MGPAIRQDGSHLVDPRRTADQPPEAPGLGHGGLHGERARTARRPHEGEHQAAAVAEVVEPARVARSRDRADDPCAVQYVSADRLNTVVMAYQVRGRVGRGARRARLRGLDPSRRYCREDAGAGVASAESTGAALMGAGLPMFPEQPAGRIHTSDWLSEIQLWEAFDA